MGLKISEHARERYCERVLGIAPENTREYLKSRVDTVNQAIYEMTNQSDYSRKDGSRTYYVSNLYLVVVVRNIAVTVIKKEFISHQLKKLLKNKRRV